MDPLEIQEIAKQYVDRLSEYEGMLDSLKELSSSCLRIANEINILEKKLISNDIKIKEIQENNGKES